MSELFLVNVLSQHVKGYYSKLLSAHNNYPSLPDIPSVDKLIEMLPEIAETMRLCHCLKVNHGRCNILEKENVSLWQQKAAIANAWFEQTDQPKWEEVVQALKCMKKIKQASDLAKRVGIDTTPLASHTA